MVKSAYYCCRGLGYQHPHRQLRTVLTPILGDLTPSSGPHGVPKHRKTAQNPKPCIRIGSNTFLLGCYPWMSIIHFESSKTRNVRLATTLCHVYNYLTCIFFVYANIYNFKVENTCFSVWQVLYMIAAVLTACFVFRDVIQAPSLLCSCRHLLASPTHIAVFCPAMCKYIFEKHLSVI